MNILELMIRDKQFRLYLSKHYRFSEVQSMVPLYREGKLIFPRQVVLQRKRLSLIDKMLFYILDFKEWLLYGK